MHCYMNVKDREQISEIFPHLSFWGTDSDSTDATMCFRLGGLGGTKAFSTSPLKVEVDLEMHIAASDCFYKF